MPNKPQHDAALLVLIKRSECGRTQLDLDQMRGILRKVRVQELFEQDEEDNVEPIEIAEGFAGAPWLAPCLRRWFRLNDLRGISRHGPTFPIDPESMEAVFQQPPRQRGGGQ